MTGSGMFPPAQIVQFSTMPQKERKLTNIFPVPIDVVCQRNDSARSGVLSRGVKRTLTSTSFTPSTVTHFLHL